MPRSPGYGRWTNERWWRRGQQDARLVALEGAERRIRTIAALDVAGNQHIRLPGLLRIVHTRFIHYEWYVPIDDDRYRYIQLFVQFKTGPGAALFRLKYLGAVRWLFHGQFTGQDRWMVDVMDCPPERLYRPDVSVTRWRTLCDHAPPQGQQFSTTWRRNDDRATDDRARLREHSRRSDPLRVRRQGFTRRAAAPDAALVGRVPRRHPDPRGDPSGVRDGLARLRRFGEAGPPDEHRDVRRGGHRVRRRDRPRAFLPRRPPHRRDHRDGGRRTVPGPDRQARPLRHHVPRR